MNDSDWRRQLAEAQQTIRELQQELEETNKGLIALNIELEQREEKFRSIFESAAEGIIIFGPDDRILSANPAAAAILGYKSPDELVGISVVDIQAEPGQRQALFAELANMGYVKNFEELLRKRDGTPVHILAAVSNHQDREGNLRTQIIFTDISSNITERKEIPGELAKQAQELSRSNAELAIVNKELEAFAYSVSHDLRAPLRSIDGFSQALLEDYADKLDTQGKNYLHRMRTAAQHMGELIDDLLALSRLTRTKMKYDMVDLTALAQRIAAALQETQPQRQVEFVIAPRLVAYGDEPLLQLLLENLLGNAWKFTGKHPRASIKFGVTQYEGKPAYFVRDDGVGFDMTYVGKLFAPFQRLHSATEFPGTGIGLATVQRIVCRHGGQVWAEGKVEEGATFYFTLGTYY